MLCREGCGVLTSMHTMNGLLSRELSSAHSSGGTRTKRAVRRPMGNCGLGLRWVTC